MMKKIIDQTSENYFSPYSHNTSQTPKIEKLKLNSYLQSQDNQPTPINQFPFQHQTSIQSQTQQQSYPNLLENLLQSANLGGVLLNFENPSVFNDPIFEDQSKNPFNLTSGQITSPNGTIYKQSLKDYRIQQYQLKKSNQMAKRIQKKQDNRPKIFVNKSTDTTEDLKIARLQYDRIEKENQLIQIQKETEENIQELTKYLKTTTEIKLNSSNVSQQIKEVAKALTKKKFETDQMLARENVREDEPGDPEEELKVIKEYLESEFIDVQKETAHKILEFINRVLKEKRSMPEKNANNKNKKGNKDKGLPKKDQEIQQLKERVGFLENKVEENGNELDKKIDEVKDLRFQVDYKEKDLTKLNAEVFQTKDELNKAEVDRRSLQTQIEKSKLFQEKLVEQKNQEEKQKEKIQQKLKKTEDRVVDIERENYILRDEIVRIQQLSKNVDEQEKVNMQVLCQMVMDSNMSPEEQKKALMRIQQLYVDHPSGNVEINQERQKYIQQMMSSFKNSNVKTFEEFEILTQKSRNSFNKFSTQELNESSQGQKNKRPVKISNKSSLSNIEEENTEITYTKEKRIIQQKVKKTVMEKKIVVDENGQQIEIEEAIEIEVEEDVEIEVDVPVVRIKNQKVTNQNQNQKKNEKTGNKSSLNNSGTPSNQNSRRQSKRENASLQLNIQNQNNQKGNAAQVTPRKANAQNNTQDKYEDALPSTRQKNTSVSKQQNTFNYNNSNNNSNQNNNNNNNNKNNKDTNYNKSNSNNNNNNEQKQQREKPKPVVLKKLDGHPNLGENVFINEEDFYEEVEKEVVEQDGYEEVEEQVIDDKGNVTIVKKTVPKMVKKTIKIKKKLSNLNDLELIEQEQEVEELVVDPNTGEEKIVKKKVMQKVAVPKSKVQQNYEFVEQESVVEEQVFDPETGQTKTVQKTVIKKVAIPKSQLANYQIEEKEVEIEEIVVDPETGQTQTIKKVVKQKVAKKVIENEDEESVFSNQSSNRAIPPVNQKNKKITVRQVMVQQEVEVSEDEEVTDSQGNKQIIKKKVKKIQMVPKMEEVVEYVDDDIQQGDNIGQISNRTKKNSQFQQQHTNRKNADTPIVKQGMAIQTTQTDQYLLWPIVEALLYELDVDPSKIQGLQQKYFDEKSPQGPGGMSLNLMELANKVQEKKQEFEERQLLKQQEMNEQELQNKEQNQLFQKYNQGSQDPFSRNDELLMMFNDNSPVRYGADGRIIHDDDDDEIDERQYEQLDDKHLLAESTIKKIFLKLQQKDNKGAVMIKELIRKYYNKPKNAPITYDEFKHYYIKVLTIHQRCGDQCPHLARFFYKIGFRTNKYGNRREIKPIKQKLNPFNEQQTKSPNFNSSNTPLNNRSGYNSASNQNSISKSSFTQAIQNKMVDSPSTPYRNANNQSNHALLSSSTTKLPKIQNSGYK